MGLLKGYHFSIERIRIGYPFLMDINCKGLQTNMLPNVGSEEDLINKNLTSRQIEFCKSDPAK